MMKSIACPGCAHEFSVEPDADLAHLVCPHCEAAIPEQVARGLSGAAEELALGFKPGQQLGNYIIEALLGSGGMGVVLRGRQLSLNRSVAIKILSKDLAKNALFVNRFDREATVLASLNHPNIVSVIDRGHEGEAYFIVMEYVEGETLRTAWAGRENSRRSRCCESANKSSPAWNTRTGAAWCTATSSPATS